MRTVRVAAALLAFGALVAAGMPAPRDEDALLASLRAAPDVPTSPHVDGPRIMGAASRALARAGYEFDLSP